MRQSPVDAAFASIRSSFVHVGVFSSILNLLMLTGSIYMLQVYDRVLTSRSVPTLIGLSILALAAFALQGLVDMVRTRILARMAARVDAAIAPLAAGTIVELSRRGLPPDQSMRATRDLDSIRSFMASTGPTAFIDMPFMPLFVLACFLLHPWLGILAIAGGAVIILLTLLTEAWSKDPSASMARSAFERQMLAETGRRNADVIVAMGLEKTFTSRYIDAHTRHVRDLISLSDTASGIGSAVKVFRFALQSAILGLGAYLAIHDQMSPGAMIAASILTSRALAPIEVAIANWKGFIAAREAYHRLKKNPALAGPELPETELPPPQNSLTVQELVVLPPNSQKPVVSGVSFRLNKGDALGLIGPSGSGKSSLAKALVGIWPSARGTVRLDGALLTQWDPALIGRSIGYLPQDVVLFDGTIAENIARLQQDASSEAIIAAAKAARAHDLIVSLPEGYETRIGEGGTSLSAGQRQRVALARAFFGDPFLIVLDEPNSNLDSDGDEALAEAIREARARGAIVIIVTHRPSGLASVGLAGAMQAGQMKAFGPRDEVLEQVLQRKPQTPPRPAAPTAFPAPHSAGSTAAAPTQPAAAAPQPFASPFPALRTAPRTRNS